MRAGLALIALSLAGTAVLAAQSSDSGTVQPPSKEVDIPPKLRKVGMWYFPNGNPDGIARVEVQAIVDTTGRIESNSIRIIHTTDSMFIPSARLTLLSATFTPGTVDGRAIRVLIQVPLNFDGSAKPRCVGNWVTTMLPPKCG